MRLPWQRRADPSPSVGSAGTRAAGVIRPYLEIRPEQSPEERARLEEMVFGRGDREPDWLRRFLDEPELDNLRTRHVAEDFSPDEEDLVRSVVESGEPRQALYNLLLWPFLIPPTLRLDVVRENLHASDPYMRLAALVGLQRANVSDPSWTMLRPHVLALLDDEEGAIRSRATVTLTSLLRRGDGEALMEAVRNARAEPSEVLPLIGALVTLGEDDAVTTLLRPEFERPITDAELPPWLLEWREKCGRPSDPPPRWLAMPALAYIPNLGPRPSPERSGS